MHTKKKEGRRFEIARLAELEPVRCPCGSTRRAFVDDPEKISSIHLVEIRKDSEVHYHTKHTETYYVLDGKGHIELDGQSMPVKKGDAILIKSGCRHRAVGKLKILNIVVPAFDPEDEHFD